MRYCSLPVHIILQFTDPPFIWESDTTPMCVETKQECENNETMRYNENILPFLCFQIKFRSSSENTPNNSSEIPNPVGYLQELCAKNKICSPIYGILKVDGPPHCPIFSTFCKVQEFYEVVTSNNKRKGKEMAARKIITCLSKGKFICQYLCKVMRKRVVFEIFHKI